MPSRDAGNDSAIPRSQVTEPELFFGIVGPMGLGGSVISSALEKGLLAVKYESEVVHVIELLHNFKRWQEMPETPAEERYWKHIEAGNELCDLMGRGDALAILTLGEIRKRRKQKTGDSLVPAPRCAYILRSLKRPDEVETLRSIYGPVFFLIAAYLPRNKRVDNLEKTLNKSRGTAQSGVLRAEAEELVATDEEERDKRYGQDVRKIFSQADVFVDASDTRKLEEQLQRFIKILFGDPAFTPTKDEYAMAHARIAALRSADLSRQVGAAISSPDGTVVSLGTNEVPKSGGGQYWEGDDPDGRREKPTSFEMRRDVLGDALCRLSEMGWLVKSKAERASTDLMGLTDEALSGRMRNARVMNAIEFGRIIHAEMAALSDALRLGVSVKGCTLYSTTFPCHGCAPHIVGAGIKKVVYIHPYPKSLAQQLFHDSIAVDSAAVEGDRIPFVPFVGISPDRYFEFFNRPTSGMKTVDGPRIAGYPETYMVAELKELRRLEGQINTTEVLHRKNLDRRRKRRNR